MGSPLVLIVEDHPMMVNALSANLRELVPNAGILHAGSLESGTHGVNRVQFPVVMQAPQEFMRQHLKLCLLIGSILAAPMLVMVYSLTFLPVLKSKTLIWFNALAALEVIAVFWISGLMNLMWPSLGRHHAAMAG